MELKFQGERVVQQIVNKEKVIKKCILHDHKFEEEE